MATAAAVSLADVLARAQTMGRKFLDESPVGKIGRFLINGQECRFTRNRAYGGVIVWFAGTSIRLAWNEPGQTWTAFE